METPVNAQRLALEILCGTGDLEGVADWLSPDHVLHQSVIEGLPPGLAATLDLARFYRRALPGLAVSIEDAFGDGDRAVTRFRVRARHTGKLGAIAPTSAPIEVTGMLVSRFGEDGRAVESWLEVGALGVLRALDVLEMVNPVRVVES